MDRVADEWMNDELIETRKQLHEERAARAEEKQVLLHRLTMTSVIAVCFFLCFLFSLLSMVLPQAITTDAQLSGDASQCCSQLSDFVEEYRAAARSAGISRVWLQIGSNESEDRLVISSSEKTDVLAKPHYWSRRTQQPAVEDVILGDSLSTPEQYRSQLVQVYNSSEVDAGTRSSGENR